MNSSEYKVRIDKKSIALIMIFFKRKEIEKYTQRIKKRKREMKKERKKERRKERKKERKEERKKEKKKEYQSRAAFVIVHHH